MSQYNELSEKALYISRALYLDGCWFVVSGYYLHLNQRWITPLLGCNVMM